MIILIHVLLQSKIGYLSVTMITTRVHPERGILVTPATATRVLHAVGRDECNGISKRKVLFYDLGVRNYSPERAENTFRPTASKLCRSAC